MKYIKLLMSSVGLIFILLNKKKYEQAKRRFLTGENDGIFGLILLYGLRLYWSNISTKKLHKERNDLWNSKFALVWHNKKDNTHSEIEFFINTFEKFIDNLPSNMDSFMEIGAGNGKNVVAIKENFSNYFNNFIGVDFQIKENKKFDIIVGGVQEALGSINGNMLVLTSGTAMYFSENELNNLYKTVKEKNAMLLLLEPTYNDDFNFFKINPIVSNYDYYKKSQEFNLECLKKIEISEDKYMKVYGYLLRSKNDTI